MEFKHASSTKLSLKKELPSTIKLGKLDIWLAILTIFLGWEQSLTFSGSCGQSSYWVDDIYNIYIN